MGPYRFLAADTDIQNDLVATVRAAGVSDQVDDGVCDGDYDGPRNAAGTFAVALRCHGWCPLVRSEGVLLPGDSLEVDLAEKANDVSTALVRRNASAVLGHQDNRDATEGTGAKGTRSGPVWGTAEHVGLDDHDAKRHTLLRNLCSFKLHDSSPPDASRIGVSFFPGCDVQSPGWEAAVIPAIFVTLGRPSALAPHLRRTPFPRPKVGERAARQRLLGSDRCRPEELKPDLLAFVICQLEREVLLVGGDYDLGKRVGRTQIGKRLSDVAPGVRIEMFEWFVDPTEWDFGVVEVSVASRSSSVATTFSPELKALKSISSTSSSKMRAICPVESSRRPGRSGNTASQRLFTSSLTGPSCASNTLVTVASSADRAVSRAATLVYSATEDLAFC